MKRVLLFILLSCLSCARGPLRSDGNGSHPSYGPQPSKAKSGDSKQGVSSESTGLNPQVVEIVNAAYEQVFEGDDKRAKLVFGRRYRQMPEIVQFALDLRFRNYEHGVSLLSTLVKSPDERALWAAVLKAKPFRLGTSVCEYFKKNPKFPEEELKPPTDSEVWAAELRHFASTLLSEEKKLALQERSELDKEIDQLTCGPNESPAADGSSEAAGCSPMSPGQIEHYFSDKYFDNLHNLQRRDTRYVLSNYRSLLKLQSYRRFVSPMSILKLYRVMQATDHPRKNHFLRRIGGVGRDLRVENLTARIIGDEILEDSKDKEFATRLERLILANPLLDLTVGLGTELASCELSTKR